MITYTTLAIFITAVLTSVGFIAFICKKHRITFDILSTGPNYSDRAYALGFEHVLNTYGQKMSSLSLVLKSVSKDSDLPNIGLMDIMVDGVDVNTYCRIVEGIPEFKMDESEWSPHFFFYAKAT